MSYKLQTKLKTKNLEDFQKYCNHNVIEVNKETRMLQCKGCKIWLDPFDFLWRWALRQEVVERNLKDLREEEKSLCEQIIELKKEEKRVKSRLKNAKKRVRELPE